MKVSLPPCPPPPPATAAAGPAPDPMERAIQASDWARFAAEGLNKAAMGLANVGARVARECHDDRPLTDRSFLLASQDVEDAWNQISAAMVNIGRAREYLVRAREEAGWQAADDEVAP